MVSPHIPPTWAGRFPASSHSESVRLILSEIKPFFNVWVAVSIYLCLSLTLSSVLAAENIPSAASYSVSPTPSYCDTGAASHNSAALESFLIEYISTTSPDVPAQYVAALLTGTHHPLLWAAVARYESDLDPKCIGGAGERGLVQIHPCHRKSMREAGLNFYSEADRLAFAEHIYITRGLRPWSVRAQALREYRRLVAAWEQYASDSGAASR